MQAAASTSAHVCTAQVSTALHQLLQACQAQADAASAVPAGSIVLAGTFRKRHIRYFGDWLKISNSPGDEDGYIRRRECPPSWRESSIPWHPSYWYAHRTRIDQHGHIWSCDSGIYLTDDYGDLVPVPEAA